MSTRRWLAPLVGMAVFIGIWEVLVRALHVRPFILRAPSSALRHLWNFRTGFGPAMWVTVQHATIGLAIGLRAARDGGHGGFFCGGRSGHGAGVTGNWRSRYRSRRRRNRD